MWYAYVQPYNPGCLRKKSGNFCVRPGLSVIAQLASGSGLKIQGLVLGSGLGLGLGLLSRAELALGALVTPVTSEPGSQFEPVGSK